MVLRKSFYIRWSAGRSPRVHEVNPGRDPSSSLPTTSVSEVWAGDELPGVEFRRSTMT